MSIVHDIRVLESELNAVMEALAPFARAAKASDDVALTADNAPSGIPGVTQGDLRMARGVFELLGGVL